MKLKKLELLNIQKIENEYVYTYGVFATSFFSKKYFKLVFKSKLPHFWWSEIQKMMLKQGVYFEDLVKGEPMDIKIGKLEYLDLTEKDIERFGKNIKIWKTHLGKAVEKSIVFKEEYDAIHGAPNLSGTGFLSDYNPLKDW